MSPRACLRLVTLVAVLVRYWLFVFPIACRALARWQHLADAIPDPILRRQARAALRNERLNSEGAALFAVIAPWRRTATVARLLVAFQVMYDYLDTLTEQPSLTPLANARQLHRALHTTVGAPPPHDGYYALHTRADDGGYLQALIDDCRSTFESLPAADTVRSAVAHAIEVSAEGQSQNHAGIFQGHRRLIEWAHAITPPDSDLRWWETAAGAGSSLATHAMLAAAANSRLTPAAVTGIANAYWPWINSLNTLLESLIDKADDEKTGNHSYISHYASAEDAAERLGTIAAQAASAARSLPRSRRHEVILAAMVSFYLAAPGAQTSEARLPAVRVGQQLDCGVGILLTMLALRRRMAR